MKTLFYKRLFTFLIILFLFSFLALAFGFFPEIRAFFIGLGILSSLIIILLRRAYWRDQDQSSQEISQLAQQISAGAIPDPPALSHFEAMGGDGVSIRRMIQEIQKRLVDLSTEKDQLKTILEGMMEGVLVTDAAGRIVLANPSLYGILPLEGRCEGKTLLECLRHQEIHDTFERAMKLRLPQEKEVTLSTEGETKILAVYVTPILNSQGTSGVILVFFDVTQTRKLENARKDFVANVSHELKTPLTSIRGYAETLRSGALQDPEVAERFVQKIETNAAQLHNLIEDLLELAEIESGRLERNPLPFPLHEAVAEVHANFSEALQKKALSFHTEIPKELKIHGEPAAMKQILSNLLDNAIKYTPEGGRISVSAQPQEEVCRVVVTDTGMGIPESDLPHVFERFYRVDKARSREVGGTGLGLAIVKHLVQTQGGEVGVRSQVGRGSEFHFTVPLSPVPDDPT